MSFLDEILTARYDWPDPHDWMAQYREVEPLVPRFDTVAVNEVTSIGTVLHARTPTHWPTDVVPDALFGFPVVLDESVDPGWLELRKGDEVIDRIRIA